LPMVITKKNATLSFRIAPILGPQTCGPIGVFHVIVSPEKIRLDFLEQTIRIGPKESPGSEKNPL